MKGILTFFALFFLCNLSAQVNNIYANAGIAVTVGAPTYKPGAKGSIVAIDSVTGTWYVSRDRYASNGNWLSMGQRIEQISGCSAPAYTPNKYNSDLVINNCAVPELYYHSGGGVWVQLNASGSTYTAGTGIAISGSNVISNTAPDQTVSLTGAGGNVITGTYPSFTITGTPATGAETIVTAGTGASVTGAGTSGSPYVVSSTITQYTDEAAQDAVGAMVDGTLVYVDGTPLLTRAALTGDATASQGSNALTIANSAVTLAKQADVATSTVFYRKTAGTGAPEVQTLATLKTDLGLTGTNSGDFTLNGLTPVTQSFSTGTSGSDFAINSATSTHTFNLPTASASNRGALSSADWTTFNSKDPSSTNEIQVANNGLSDNEASGILRLGNRYMNGSDGLFTMDRKVNLSGFVGYFGDNTDSSLLVLDGVNDRLGVGVAPSGKLHVKGAGTSTGIGFEVDNSDATITTKLLDNGQFQMLKSAVNFFKITPGSSGIDGTVALGRATLASGTGSTALGPLSEATGTYATALGAEAYATSLEAVALGRYSISSGSQSFSFGHFINNTLANAFLIGNGQDANSSGLLTGLYVNSVGIGSKSRVPQFVVRGLLASTLAWTASGNTVTMTGHGLTAGEPIVLHGPTYTYHTVSSVTDANTFVVSGSAPGASGTVKRTYPGNIIEVTNGTDGTILAAIDKFGKFGIGTSSPDRLLQSESSDAITNAVTYPERLTHITSGTAATGFGAGQEIELENASGTNRVAQTEETTWSDATNATEDATWKLRLIKAGTLTDAVTVTSTGDVTAAASITGTNLISTATVRLKGYTVATLPAGVVGDMAYVTDALAPAYGVAVVGGGAVVTPCFFNGTVWTTR